MHVGALVYFTQDMYVSSVRKWWVQVPRPFYSYFVYTSLLASNRPQTILFLDMENLSDFLTAVDIRSLVCLYLCVYTQAHEYVGACILGAHGYGGRGQQHCLPQSLIRLIAVIIITVYVCGCTHVEVGDNFHESVLSFY